MRRGGVPAGTDAVVLLTIEELAVNDLRETFHHWVRTLALPVKKGALGKPLTAARLAPLLARHRHLLAGRALEAPGSP